MNDTVKETNGREEIIQWHKLDERAVTLWKINEAIGFSIFFFIILTGGTALWLFIPFPGFILFSVILIVIILFCFNFLWLPGMRYGAWLYRLNDTIIEFKSGIVFKKSVMIPLSRLQHADLIQGPVEQHMNLSSLKIHTAGTHAASHKISGLDAETAGQLRNDLIAAAKIKHK